MEEYQEVFRVSHIPVQEGPSLYENHPRASLVLVFSPMIKST